MQSAQVTKQYIKLPPERKYENELSALIVQDSGPKPDGWKLSPKSVRKFILGAPELGITQKVFGNDDLVERSIITLIGNQGLMLVGEPGTAKTLLSELLSSAISGDSRLTIQGTAGTTEDQIKYTWNYALLLNEGPCEKALVPAPIYEGMTQGKLVRFEEITRCPAEVQDSVISILSDKQLLIAEWGDSGRILARQGFNLIATANLRDKGVNTMSSALKRRFNFETVQPLTDLDFEVELVMQEVTQQFNWQQYQVELPTDLVTMLVQAFQELRGGTSKDGIDIKRPSTVMSTAEAVNLLYGAGLRSAYLGIGKVTAEDIASQLIGVVLKDDADDRKKLAQYFNTVGQERARRNKHWKTLVNAIGKLS